MIKKKKSKRILFVTNFYNPYNGMGKFIIDLATLTGAIIVSLGSEYAGLFSNDDNLSKQNSFFRNQLWKRQKN